MPDKERYTKTSPTIILPINVYRQFLRKLGTGAILQGTISWYHLGYSHTELYLRLFTAW